MTGRIVVMGPSGNGKSTLGHALAEALGYTFIEGDLHHPARNVAKMARGEPLTDEDRQPFLQSVGRALANEPEGAVAACSALKKVYRDQLRDEAGIICFVLPRLGREELSRRMSQRSNHFMPPSLLDSQLADLEIPDGAEMWLETDGLLPVAEQVQAILSSFARSSPA